MAKRKLYEMVAKWEEDARLDARDSYPFRALLEDVLFHAAWRFRDYKQYSNEGEFATRLRKWLDNVSDERQRKTLFRLLGHTTFIDRKQMDSLHADAFRRIIVPWICGERWSRGDFLANDFDHKLRSQLQTVSLLSITDSFGFNDFLHVNDLHGLPRPQMLGEDGQFVESIVAVLNKSTRLSGIIVFEDFVGTGQQGGRVLNKLRASLSPDAKILFVPLIILELNVEKLRRELSGITIEPVLIVPNATCVRASATCDEPADYVAFRSIVRATSSRVTERNDHLDDPPTNAFGYGGCGMLFVTCHNVPNNTLPLIHHRSPRWEPLFRRLHHSKDGL